MSNEIFQYLPKPALVTTQDGLIVDSNKAVCELFNCPPEDINGNLFSDWIEDENDQFLTIINALVCNDEEVKSERYKCSINFKNQKYNPKMQISCFPYENEKHILIQLNISNAISLVRNNKQIDINKRLRFIVDNMLEGVQIMSNKFEYIYLNNVAEKQSQMNRDDLIGFKFQEKYPGVENTELFKLMEQCLVDQIKRQLENEFNFPNGEKGWFQLSIQPMGDLLFILSIDITEVKKAQLVMLKQNEALRHKNDEVLEYQAKLLCTQINPHFIFNVLNSIQHYILKRDVEPALNFVSDFLKLMRTMLENSLEKYIPLSKTIEFLDIYMKLEQTRLENKFDYTCLIQENIDTDEILVPPMIFQPYLENAIKHGISHLNSRGTIQMELKLENQLLICKITDNGVGRKESQRLLVEYGYKKHNSMALSLTKKRLEILSQIENSIYNIEFEDILGSDGKCQGTKVIVTMPLIANNPMLDSSI